MTSKRVVTLLATMVLSACQQSVHDVSFTSDSLLVLHGHVDVSALPRAYPNAPLIAALVWAAVPQINSVCLAPHDDRINAACPDPYGVFYGEIDRSQYVRPDGTFDIALSHLPKASVSVGDAATRIAYGSLLVAEDVNGDGALSLEGRQSESDGGVPHGGAAASDQTLPDNIVGATFHSLHATQTRLVFREGGFVANSNFYPTENCAAPPPGFSFLTTSPYVGVASDADADAAVSDAGAEAASQVCTFSAAQAVIEVPPISHDEGLALMCRAIQSNARIQEPGPDRDEQPDQSSTSVCLSAELLASIRPGLCPRMTAYALKACRRDAFCPKPEWDQTRAIPDWWPCH